MSTETIKPTERGTTSATSRVWMAERRKGLTFHAVESRQTKCGKFVGAITRGVPEAGILPKRGEAVDEIKGRPCRKCYDTQASRRQPNVAPSKDRRPASRGRA